MMVSVRRVAPVLLLVIATASVAVTASAQKHSSRPPRDLHRVGDHWTAYNPPDPATYPAGARTHTIKSGDTLWQLAQQYYSNAYLWPQLWESNTWITDAHWIYPGDVLLVARVRAR
jgi:nucleoid-associated protein YgaU